MPIDLERKPSLLGRLRYWWPNHTDHYLLKEVVAGLIGGLAFLISLVMMFQVLRLSEYLISHQAFDLTGLEILFLIVTGFLPYLLPVALLVSVLSTFARLSGESELVAMKASGMSIFRISLPLFGVGILSSIISLILSTYLLPLAETQLRTMYNKLGNTRVVSAIEEGRFTPGFFDLLIFVDHKDSTNGRMKRVFIFDERDEKHPVAVLAQEAALNPVQTESESGSAGILRMFNGSIHRPSTQGGPHQRIEFGEYRLFLNLEGGKEQLNERPRMLSSFELAERIKTLEPGSRDYKKHTVELASRLAGALSGPLLVLLGIGLGASRGRGSRANAILLSLLVFLLYWGIQSLGIQLCWDQSWNPHIALNLPNLLAGVLAAFSLHRANW